MGASTNGTVVGTIVDGCWRLNGPGSVGEWTAVLGFVEASTNGTVAGTVADVGDLLLSYLLAVV